MEQAAVNRKVEGSNPFSGATRRDRFVRVLFFSCNLAGKPLKMAFDCGAILTAAG